MGVFLFGVGSLKSGKSECDFNVGSTFPIFKPFEGSVYISGSSHPRGSGPIFWLRAQTIFCLKAHWIHCWSRCDGSNHVWLKAQGVHLVTDEAFGAQ